MAEIEANDILSLEALERPLKLKENFKVTAQEIDDFIDTALHMQKVVGDTKSMKTLTDQTEKLAEEEKKLTGIQQQLNDKLKQSEKEVNKLKDDVKRLTEEQKKQADSAKKQGEAMDALNNRVGGVIGQMKQLGKELMMIAKSPVILALAALVGILAACTSAVKLFWSSTGEGEDQAARQAAVWNQFFVALKEQWIDLGKTISDYFGTGSSVSIVNKLITALEYAFPFLTIMLEKIRKDFNKTAKEAEELADVIDDIQTRAAVNIVRRAETERAANEAVRKSIDELEYSDQQRLEFLKEFIRLKEEQMLIDVKLAKENARAVLLAIGLEHNLSKAVVERMTFAEMDAKFTGEEMKRLMEARAAAINLEAQYFQEVKKNEGKIITLREQIHKKEVDLLFAAAEKKNQLAKDELEKAIQRVRDEVLAGTKLKEDGDKEIVELRKRNMAQLIQIQMQGLEQILKMDILNAEERAKVELSLHDLRIKLNEALYDQVAELKEVTVESGMSQVESLRNIYTSLADSVSGIYDGFTQRRMDQIQAEEDRLTQYYDKQIEMAGDNVKKKTKLEDEFDKKMRAIDLARIKAQRRAAIFERAVAGVQAVANVALAATNQAAKGDPYSAFARVAAIVAALAPFIAMVASKDIPQYKGGGNTTAPIIIAGEEGTEHYKTPDGREGFTPNRASLMALPVGTKITPHKETMEMLAMNGINTTVAKSSDQFTQMMNHMISSNRSLEHTIKNKKEMSWNITKKGIEKAFINGNSRQYFLDNIYK
jgi:hypothetical protein